MQTAAGKYQTRSRTEAGAERRLARKTSGGARAGCRQPFFCTAQLTSMPDLQIGQAWTWVFVDAF